MTRQAPMRTFVISDAHGYPELIPGLEEYNFHMIDPCAWLGMDVPGRCRYAVIEEGRVSVADATPAPRRLTDCAV